MFINNKKRKIILYEWGQPTRIEKFLNYAGGIWKLNVTPGTVVVTDDNSNTGYYSYDNEIVYNVQFITVNNKQYSRVNSLDDLYANDESWYYDSVNMILYICFYNYDPPLANKIYIGVIYGFSKNSDYSFYNDSYYDSRIKSIFGVKKSKDALFFGILKFSSGKVTLINTDGEFDNWNTFNSFRQPSRILIGEEGDDYTDFKQVFSGIIGNYSYSRDEISIDNNDVRSALTNPIPVNKYVKADYANLGDNSVDKFKPIAYGDIRGGICVCLNETASSPATYSFSFMDVTHYAATSVSTVYVNNVAKTPTVNLSAGTFTLAASDVDGKYNDVTIDFCGANIKNGVEIIKDVMEKYGDTAYLSSTYDQTETAAASTTAGARSTCLYASSQTELNKLIEQICVDIDGLFFAKDNGLYTVRIYDANRTPVKTIIKDDWIDSPQIENNTDEFLSSVIIDYSKNQKSNTYRSFVNTDYEQDVIDMYGSTKSKTIKTNLTTSAGADAKSEVVLASSKEIKDVVSRSVNFSFYDLEIMDFVIADPKCRIIGTEIPAIWEVISIDKNIDNWSIGLKLRYIKEL
jgi:hypothetical protein